MKHMTIDDRNRLEFLAACGCSAKQIAEDRGRSPSAIRDEFLNHRIPSEKERSCPLGKKYYIASAAQTAYDLFVAQYGDEGKAFLDMLGITRIPAAQVTLHPFLPGQKYQRAADRAILKKHGVIGQKKTEEKK